MPAPGTITGALTDELGDLGKSIVREAVAVPKDIAGKALESLGTPTSQKPQQQKPTTAASARAALAALAGPPKPKEPSVWERMQAEAEQKKEMRKHQRAQAAEQALPVVKPKRARGDLYGIKAKKFSGEVGKNIRQD